MLALKKIYTYKEIKIKVWIYWNFLTFTVIYAIIQVSDYVEMEAQKYEKEDKEMYM